MAQCCRSAVFLRRLLNLVGIRVKPCKFLVYAEIMFMKNVANFVYKLKEVVVVRNNTKPGKPAWPLTVSLSWFSLQHPPFLLTLDSPAKL